MKKQMKKQKMSKQKIQECKFEKTELKLKTKININLWKEIEALTNL